MLSICLNIFLSLTVRPPIFSEYSKLAHNYFSLQLLLILILKNCKITFENNYLNIHTVYIVRIMHSSLKVHRHRRHKH